MSLYGCGCHSSKNVWKITSSFSSRKFVWSFTKRVHSKRFSLKTAQTDTDPFKITQSDISNLHKEIRDELSTDILPLNECSQYYFDGQGKLIRPITVMLMGRACNIHQNNETVLNEGQKRIAMIAEMIHTASLLHDDVIDEATTRRNKPSVNHVFTQKQAILAGDYILSRSSILLAQVGNTKAVEYFSHIINDLVKGELMQLFTKDDINERFNHYLAKTFRKTASLIAYSCRSVALLGGCGATTRQAAHEYGKNIGIAFQLVDDALDFVSNSEELGKPTGADLSLGLATAPILFAAQKFPDLHSLISRRFKQEGDIEMAFDLVKKSDGVSETIMMAQKYADQAIKNIQFLRESEEKRALINLANIVINRSR